MLSEWISASHIVIMTLPVMLIADNLRIEKIDCVCQVVEVDLLGSNLDKIVWELIKRSWCYKG